MIYYYEELEVAIVDAPGAFMTSDEDEVINMTLRNNLAKLIVKTAPEFYRNYVLVENGKNGAISTATKGIINMPTQCTAVIQEADSRIGIFGI